MKDGLQENTRSRRRYAVACWVFAASIVALFAANIVVNGFEAGRSWWKMVLDFVLPAGLAAAMYLTGWLERFLIWVLRCRAAKLELTAMVVTAASAVVLMQLGQWLTDEYLNFALVVLAVAAMCTVAYTFKRMQGAALAIIAQVIVFILLAINFYCDIMAVILVGLTAMQLILEMGKKKLHFFGEKDSETKTMLAVVLLVLVVFAAIALDRAGDWQLYLNDDLYEDAGSLHALINAKVVGSIANGNFLYLENYIDREFTYVLIKDGWIGVVPILLALVLMMVSGKYIADRKESALCFAASACMGLIFAQSLFYIAAFAGLGFLSFGEMCPFLDGNVCYNTVFLLMAVIIMPHRRVMGEVFRKQNK